MTNTIKLLETIGRDASLRNASQQHLAKALDGMGASESLKMAAVSGDRDVLKQELGHKDNKVNHNPPQTTGGCEPDGDGMEVEPEQDDEGRNGQQSLNPEP